MKAHLCVLFLVAGCDADKIGWFEPEDSGELLSGDDQSGPLFTHQPIEDSQPFGQDVAIACTAIDPESSVLAVTVYFKQETHTVWDDALLQPVGDEGNYEGVIPGDEVAGGGIDYYLEAIDTYGNTTTLPGYDDPYHFRVSM